MMRQARTTEQPVPDAEESWWAALLAEDSRQFPGPLSSDAVMPDAREQAAEASAPRTSLDWGLIRGIYLRDEIVVLKVTGHNRGGLLVDGGGLSGFVPLSHLVGMAGRDNLSDREQALDDYVGLALKLKMIECAPEDGRIIFSERAALTAAGQRPALLSQLHQGRIVSGTVTNITDFGAFVDLGGVEGLIHISELSWGRVLHPSQVVSVGQVIQVQVLELTPERCRVALSLKRLHPNPWQQAHTEFPVGRVLHATITRVVSFGAFARLDAGVEGLIHISEMNLPEGRTVKEFLQTGQEVTVRVLRLDQVHRRLGLSMRSDPSAL